MQTSSIVNIKKGIDIPIKGTATENYKILPYPKEYCIAPDNFENSTLKLCINEGDTVQIGSPVFFHVEHPDIYVVSPISGIVKEIRRGEKRKIKAVIIESDDCYQTINFDISQSPKEILMKCGLWNFIKERPFDIVANPQSQPKAVFISTFATEPLAPHIAFLLKNQESDFAKGLEIIANVAHCPIHLGLKKDETFPAFKEAVNIQKHSFNGPHPSGLLSTQIQYINPINKGEIVWTIHPQDVALIGHFFNTKILNFKRNIAFCGSEATETFYTEVIIGQSVKTIIDTFSKTGNIRYISGNILNGDKIESDGFIGFYARQLIAFPEGGKREFFGWITPGYHRWSFSHTFLSKWIPKKEYVMNTSMNGGSRNIVFSEVYNNVVPLDIYPVELLKACLIKDIELMEELGIYEVVPEDFALCEVICPSKTPCQAIVKEALEYIRKEV